MSKEIKVCIVIPSLEPQNTLLKLLEELRTQLNLSDNLWIYAEIIIVDDGSRPEYGYIFQQTKDQYGCILLRHAVNMGKGRALKTAFNHFLNVFPDFHGVVTADSDGQHTAEDIIRCTNELYNTHALILGSRDFEQDNVPFKSRVGNKLTRSVFRFLCDVSVSDTQTGLRGIPSETVARMLTVPGERFEYEMNMLIECGKFNTEIKEIKIQTIYNNANKGTHFNPLLDSIKIYYVFIKYILSSLSTSIIDITFFALFQTVFNSTVECSIMLATIGARVFSSLYNYIVNKSIVFSQNKGVITAIKYYIVVICQMLLSGYLTILIYLSSPLHEISSKILIDTFLFLVIFKIQKQWVFADKKVK